MPQLATAVLKDSANADHTFTPDGIQGNVATLVESTGVPIGNKSISISVNKTTNGRRKVIVKAQFPVVQDAVVSGVSRPTVVRTGYADITMSFDATSSTAERKDVIAYIKSLLGTEMFDDVAADLQPLY